MKWYQQVYYILFASTYILYFAILLNAWHKAPYYLSKVNLFLQAFVGVMLLWFFRPHQKQQVYDSFHTSVAFTAGFFLVSSTILIRWIEWVQEVIHKRYPHVLNNQGTSTLFESSQVILDSL